MGCAGQGRGAVHGAHGRHQARGLRGRLQRAAGHRHVAARGAQHHLQRGEEGAEPVGGLQRPQHLSGPRRDGRRPHAQVPALRLHRHSAGLDAERVLAVSVPAPRQVRPLREGVPPAAAGHGRATPAAGGDDRAGHPLLPRVLHDLRPGRGLGAALDLRVQGHREVHQGRGGERREGAVEQAVHPPGRRRLQNHLQGPAA
mmetsp:Transcript_54057/g.153975  ORF Transcript_54057/g.153975 Transcript_54057/m.153975 type:complete len:200 (-) Transcript_54057:81-680(-)